MCATGNTCMSTPSFTGAAASVGTTPPLWRQHVPASLQQFNSERSKPAGQGPSLAASNATHAVLTLVGLRGPGAAADSVEKLGVAVQRVDKTQGLWPQASNMAPQQTTGKREFNCCTTAHDSTLTVSQNSHKPRVVAALMIAAPSTNSCHAQQPQRAACMRLGCACSTTCSFEGIA